MESNHPLHPTPPKGKKKYREKKKPHKRPRSPPPSEEPPTLYTLRTQRVPDITILKESKALKKIANGMDRLLEQLQQVGTLTDDTIHGLNAWAKKYEELHKEYILKEEDVFLCEEVLLSGLGDAPITLFVSLLRDWSLPQTIDGMSKVMKAQPPHASCFVPCVCNALSNLEHPQLCALAQDTLLHVRLRSIPEFPTSFNPGNVVLCCAETLDSVEPLFERSSHIYVIGHDVQERDLPRDKSTCFTCTSERKQDLITRQGNFIHLFYKECGFPIDVANTQQLLWAPGERSTLGNKFDCDDLLKKCCEVLFPHAKNLPIIVAPGECVVKLDDKNYTWVSEHASTHFAVGACAKNTRRSSSHKSIFGNDSDYIWELLDECYKETKNEVFNPRYAGIPVLCFFASWEIHQNRTTEQTLENEEEETCSIVFAVFDFGIKAQLPSSTGPDYTYSFFPSQYPKKWTSDHSNLQRNKIDDYLSTLNQNEKKKKNKKH